MKKNFGKVVALIPARGGSKRVQRKNITKIEDKPLICYAIDAALNSKVDEVWVSTEDQEIKKVALGCGARVLDRPEELASDTATTESVMLDFSDKVMFDLIILVECTYPLMRSTDIDGVINKYREGNYDSVLTIEDTKFFRLSMTENKQYVYPVNFDHMNRKRTQEFEGTYVEEGGIWITSRNFLQETKCRMGGRMGYYLLDHPSIDIDTKVDLEIAKVLRKWTN